MSRRVALGAVCAFLCALSSAGRLPAQESRPRTAAPADEARLLELWNEARAAVEAGDLDGGVTIAREAIALRASTGPARKVAVATAASFTGFVLWTRNRASDALPVFEAAEEVFAIALGPKHAFIARMRLNRGQCLADLRRHGEARAMFEDAVRLRRALHPRADPDGAQEELLLARSLAAENRREEALAVLLAGRARSGPSKGDAARVAFEIAFESAVCLRALERTAEAAVFEREALALAEREFGETSALTLNALTVVAESLRELGRPAEALPYAEKALRGVLAVFPGDYGEGAATYCSVGHILVSLGRHAEAAAKYEAALAMRRRLGPDDLNAAACLAGIAGVAFDAGRPAEALALIEEALAIAIRDSGPGHQNVARMRAMLAVYLRALGRPAEARAASEEGLASLRAVYPGDDARVARALSMVGEARYAVGAFEEARASHEEAAAMRRRLYAGDHLERAFDLRRAGSWALLDGRPAAALERLESAVAMLRRLADDDRPDVVETENLLAAALVALGRGAEARPRLERAIAAARSGAYRALPDLLARAGSLPRGVADAALREAWLAEAAETFEARRADLARLSEGERVAYETKLAESGTYAALADVRLERGDVAGAFAALERRRGRGALDLLARARTDPMAEALRRAEARGDAAGVAAIDAARRRVTSAESDVASAMRAEEAALRRRDLAPESRQAERVRAAAASADARRALDAADAARARLVAATTPIGRPAEIAELRALLGARGRLVAYDVRADRSRVFVVRPGAEGVAAFDLGWPDGGPVGGAALLRAVDDYRSALISEGRVATMRGVDDAAPDSRAAAAATNSAALGRRLFAALVPAALATELAASDRVDLVPDGPLHRLPFEALRVDAAGDAAARYWIDSFPPITYAASGSAAASARRLGDGLRRDAAEFALLAVGDPRGADGARAAGEIAPPQEGALVVSVVDGGPGANAGVRRGDVVVAYGGRTIADAKALGAAEAAAALAAEDVPRPAQVAIELWRAGERVGLMAPPGKLGLGVAKEPPPVAWRELAAGREARIALVERGGSGFDPALLPPLPGAAREVASIASALAGRVDPRRGELRVRALVGPAATEPAVFAAAPRARALHFAAHHVAEECDDPAFTALVLAPPVAVGREDDGTLSVRDLLERWRDRLPATELVVLSACETQGGRRALERGFHALPIAFQFAGVPAVVASHWRVEDQATADLMVDFYGRLFDPSLDQATAGGPVPSRLERFTAARKALRARRPEPYFWAPFVWTGDPR